LVTGVIDNSGKVFDKGILSIVRKHRAVIKWSVLRDREEIVSENGYDFLLSEQYRSKSDLTYTYNGRVVEFIGADDQQKIRGKKRDIAYCNEANELWFRDEFFQLFIRTTYKTIIDFNPDDEYIWINTELEQKRAIEEWDVDIIVSTYKDNPFLDANLVKEIERLEKIDQAYWNIYWLGNYWKLEGLVFPRWTEIGEIPEWFDFLWYWQDFWYTNDPTTVVWLYKKWDDIIFDEVIYKTGLTNQDIIIEYENNSINRSDEIVADSAEPKSIEEIYRSRYNIHPADKWPDSIKFGIDTIKQYNILITSRSSNIKRELRTYTWKKDKNWNSLNEPIDSNNHAIDAMRYISTKKLKTTPVFEIIFW
jgi:phage terminase large subunit